MDETRISLIKQICAGKIKNLISLRNLRIKTSKFPLSEIQVFTTDEVTKIPPQNDLLWEEFFAY